MNDGITLKVYNKEDKLNILIRNTKLTKTVSIYKYNGENVDTHSFTCANEGYEMKPWQAYYELRIEIDGKVKETIQISQEFIEQFETAGELETVSTKTNLNSGNVYKRKTKYFEGEVYVLEFKNGELFDFPFNLQKKKIKEYLEKL